MTIHETKKIKIGSREIGEGHPTYIIFEVASTHENNWEMACNYVDQAADAGADAVKFQLFTADNMIAPITKPLKGTYDYFKTAETPREWFVQLKKKCEQRKIDLLCAPFDVDGASFLNQIGVPAIKIASGELTHTKLLERVAGFGKPILVSTGMATLDEVREAVFILRKNGAKEILLFQCVSVYPTSFEDANVSAMQTLQQEFKTLVGYSDNGSEGFLVPFLAVALGASIIEKHVTSKKERGSLDDKFSLTVEEFQEMVFGIRELEKQLSHNRIKCLESIAKQYGENFVKALGDGVKRPAPHGTLVTHPGVSEPLVQKESDERHWARRGVYPIRNIRRGEKITEADLIFLRPDVGISGFEYQSVLGKTVGEDLPARLPLKIQDNQVLRFYPEDAKAFYTHTDDQAFVENLIRYSTFGSS